jgi:hypothetical protein
VQPEERLSKDDNGCVHDEREHVDWRTKVSFEGQFKESTKFDLVRHQDRLATPASRLSLVPVVIGGCDGR